MDYQYIIYSVPPRTDNTPVGVDRRFVTGELEGIKKPYPMVSYSRPLSLQEIDEFRLIPITESRLLQNYSFRSFDGWETKNFNNKVKLTTVVHFLEKDLSLWTEDVNETTQERYVGDYITYTRLVRQLIKLNKVPPFIQNAVGVDKKHDEALLNQYRKVRAEYPGRLMIWPYESGFKAYGPDAKRVADILKIPLVNTNQAGELGVQITLPKAKDDRYLRQLERAGETLLFADDPTVKRAPAGLPLVTAHPKPYSNKAVVRKRATLARSLKAAQKKPTKRRSQVATSPKPREYVYQLTIRPALPENTPKGVLRHFTRDNLPPYESREFGSVVYAEPLPVREIQHYSLIPVTELARLNGREWISYEDMGMTVVNRVQWNPKTAELSILEFDKDDHDTRHVHPVTYAQLLREMPTPPSAELRKYQVGDYVEYEGSNETKQVRITAVNPPEFLVDGYISYKGRDIGDGVTRFFSETQFIQPDASISEGQRRSDDAALAREAAKEQPKDGSAQARAKLKLQRFKLKLYQY